MLFLIRFTFDQPINMTQKELLRLVKEEARVALEAKRAGVVKALYKVAVLNQVISIIDVPSHRELDRIFTDVPMRREMGHSVRLEVLPIYPYEEFAEDLDSNL